MRFLIAILALVSTAQAAAPIAQFRNKHSVSNVTTSAWVSMGTLTQGAKQVHVFNSSNSGTLYLASGTVQVYIIPPNTNTVVPLSIGKGQVSLKAVDASVTLGDTVLNFFLAN